MLQVSEICDRNCFFRLPVFVLYNLNSLETRVKRRECAISNKLTGKTFIIPIDTVNLISFTRWSFRGFCFCSKPLIKSDTHTLGGLAMVLAWLPLKPCWVSWDRCKGQWRAEWGTELHFPCFLQSIHTSLCLDAIQAARAR